MSRTRSWNNQEQNMYALFILKESVIKAVEMMIVAVTLESSN